MSDLQGWRRAPDEARLREDPDSRPFTCGTRTVRKRAPGDFRVVCATCLGGGSSRYMSRTSATSAAVKMSGRPCPCGAR